MSIIIKLARNMPILGIFWLKKYHLFGISPDLDTGQFWLKKTFFEVTPKDEIYRTKAKYSLAFLYAATTISFDIYDIFILCTHRKKSRNKKCMNGQIDKWLKFCSIGGVNKRLSWLEIERRTNCEQIFGCWSLGLACHHPTLARRFLIDQNFFLAAVFNGFCTQCQKLQNLSWYRGRCSFSSYQEKLMRVAFLNMSNALVLFAAVKVNLWPQSWRNSLEICQLTK